MMIETHRPIRLSKWVFFGTENDIEFNRLLGGDEEYIGRVRAANRPVIVIEQHKQGKYRWTLEIDTVEGFDGECRVKLSPEASRLAFELMHSKKSVKPDSSPCIFFSCGSAQYSSIEDAVDVANKLAAMSSSSYVFGN